MKDKEIYYHDESERDGNKLVSDDKMAMAGIRGYVERPGSVVARLATAPDCSRLSQLTTWPAS